MKTIIKTLGSLSFALSLIGALVVVLTASTLLESAYGTPFVQKFFYNAGWFDIFLGLVTVNILFSALSRWPYKLHHTGFLITHAGILILLAGSLMTRLVGIDGQMALLEGEKKDFIVRQEYELAVHEPEKKVHVWPLKSISKKVKMPLKLDNPARKLTLERIEEGVLFVPEIRAGETSAEKNHAIEFTLESEMAKLHEHFWLVENSVEPSFSRRLSVGLADIELKEGEAKSGEAVSPEPTEPQLRLTQKNTGKVFTMKLIPGQVPDISSKDIGITVSDVIYYPNAQVNEKNELVNASGGQNNPAVRFTLDDGNNHREQRVLFTLFPDFESIHGKKSETFKDFKAELLAPESKLADNSSKSGLTFYFSDKGWTYEARAKSGTLTGEVKVGASQPTGWMDFNFRVDQVMDNAVVENKLSITGDPKKGDVGALLSLTENGVLIGSQWVVPHEPATFETPEGPFTAALGVSSTKLPFQLKLIDFRKKDYPGTNNAASYESDVLLSAEGGSASGGEASVDHITIQKTIWMNHPLDYKGYRIFQSSFSQDPEQGELSVFTIAKNPGIIFIYGGCIVMFLGIVCVFYVKPFSYLNTRSSHASAKK